MNARISNDKEPSCLPWRVGYTKLKADPCPPHRAVSLTSRLKQKSSKLWRFAFRSSPASSHQHAESQSMSQSRPPYDPAQLPRQQSSHPRAGEMAQTQRPPSFPSAGFLGQSNQRPVPGPQLPPLLGLQGQQRAVGGSARPAGLSPMEPSPSVNDAAGQQGGRVIPVSQLLSNSPPSPRRAAYNAAQHEQAPTGAYRTPPQMMQISPNAMYQQRAVHQPAPQPHRLDHPPQYMNQMQPQYQVQPGPPRQPMPQQYVSPTGAPKNGPQYSPAPTNYSTPSCYDSQSEVSPTSTAAPPMPFSRVSQTPPLNYNLTIRQQPAAARACGFGERDRRVIDPPPILELKITDKATGAPEQDHQGMLALHCTLLNPSNQDDETQAPAIGTDMQSTRRLMGTLVASPYPAKDENQVAGTFFVFPDLSCRAPGRYRLHFKLLRIDPLNMQQGAVHGTVASCITDVFSVYTAKDFPGMRASSALLKALRRQGLNVGVKKGSEARRGNRRAKKEDASSSEDEDSDGSGDERGGGAGGRMMIDSMPAQGGDLSAKMNRVSKKHKRRRDS